MRMCVRVTLGALAVVAFAGTASAGFDTFVIRNGGSGAAPTIQPYVPVAPAPPIPGAIEFIIDEGGMKAGWGSDDINGFTIGGIDNLSITRHDDRSRFTAGSGPNVAPYFNLWVTDGTNYAVVANEPSNPAFHSLFTLNGDGSYTYNLSFADLSDKAAKIYETPGTGDGTSWVHTAVGKVGASSLTFADLASLIIGPPAPTDYPVPGVGAGAPDELGTNIARGFNWVFGDTLSNYVSGDPGYIVSGASATASVVPVPAAAPLVLLGMSIVGFASRRSRKKKS